MSLPSRIATIGVRKIFLAYFILTLCLWSGDYASRQCFQWQNMHQNADMELRDKCLNIWDYISSSSAIFQLMWLVVVVFFMRGLDAKPLKTLRIITGLTALAVLLTNFWIIIFIFRPNLS